MERDSTIMPLLEPDEAPAVELFNINGSSNLVLVCDHASNRIPRQLHNLGLDAIQLADHISWDPGAAKVARCLSFHLNAPLVLSGYSRLVIDCNRALYSKDSIPEQSAGVFIPGNYHLSARDKEERINTLFMPYHNTIKQLLDSRSQRANLLLSIHSFTAVLNDQPRPWHIGISHWDKRLFAERLIQMLANHKDLIIGINKPYPIEKHNNYTIPIHGGERGLPSAMIEIRQDGIQTTPQAAVWAQRLASAYQMIEAEVLSSFK